MENASCVDGCSTSSVTSAAILAISLAAVLPIFAIIIIGILLYIIRKKRPYGDEGPSLSKSIKLGAAEIHELLKDSAIAIDGGHNDHEGEQGRDEEGHGTRSGSSREWGDPEPRLPHHQEITVPFLAINEEIVSPRSIQEDDRDSYHSAITIDLSCEDVRGASTGGQPSPGARVKWASNMMDMFLPSPNRSAVGSRGVSDAGAGMSSAQTAFKTSPSQWMDSSRGSREVSDAGGATGVALRSPPARKLDYVNETEIEHG